ncbi:DUF1589 domain-containing protein [Rhodopirellula sp. UBA1907]|uniref:DUF1589 domain-containing protein n=1 Tax=Rhodopirellula TaxID=265488 RepID=UPI0039C8D269
MLWDKARRAGNLRRPSGVCPATPPGTAWPTSHRSQPAALARPPLNSPRIPTS